MAKNIPTVRYHTTVYLEGNESIFESCVENVVKVINGTLESVLHLIGYSYPQIRQIDREQPLRYRTNQKVEFVLSFLENQISREIQNQRPTRAHVVECDNRLFGVIVDEGRARICGQISRVISKIGIDGKSSVVNRGFKIRSKNSSELQPMNCEEELKRHLESGQNFVIVSEKGSAFIVPNYRQNEHQYQNNLTLILGHVFAIIDDSIVHWIRSKQHLREERRESTQLMKNESIIASSAAICITDKDIKVFGFGSVVNIKNIKEFYSCL